MELGFDALRNCLAHVRIAHHIRGRIRLRLVRLPDLLQTQELRPGVCPPSVADIPGVHAVRVNPLALSCCVEYDPQVIPVEAWSDFLAGVDSPAAAILERILQGVYREVFHDEL